MNAGDKIFYQNKLPEKPVKTADFSPINAVYTLNQKREVVK